LEESAGASAAEMLAKRSPPDMPSDHRRRLRLCDLLSICGITDVTTEAWAPGGGTCERVGSSEEDAGAASSARVSLRALLWLAKAWRRGCA
jgi:hypothetical protein